MHAVDVTDARMAEVGWIVDYLADLEADFRAHYHLSSADMLALPGPEFFRLATRTVAYAGVMQARAQALQGADEAASAPVAAAPARSGRAAADGVVEHRTASGDVIREIPPTADAIARSELGGLIEMGS